jgi:cytochrome b561
MLRSTRDHYGAIAASIHWVSTLAIILLLASGLVLDTMEGEEARTLLRVHVPLGIAVAVLTLVRIVWWLAFDKHPSPPADLSPAQKWASRLVHLGLYGAIIVMVVSGIGMVVLTGALPDIFSAGALPEFSEAPPAPLHGLMGRLLLVLAAGHILAALYHQLVRRDNLIGRMRIGG